MTNSSRVSVLFACRDNAALSLMAEAVAHRKMPHLRAFSGGLSPRPVDLAAVECLHAARIPADGLSSKPLDLFALPGAPRIDLIVSLVEEVEENAAALAHTVACRTHRRWRLEDPTLLAEPHARLLAYRDLLRSLAPAIGALTRETATAA